MGNAITGVDGISEFIPLAAILALSGNINLNPKNLYWDHTDDILKHGPEGSRVAVTITGITIAWLNMYGTSMGMGQDENTAEAPVQFGDANNRYGDNSEVVSIAHNGSFEGVYDAGDPYWKALRTAKDAFGKNRLLYHRFFPRGKVGGAEVWHGVMEPRGPSTDFPREDFLTFSHDMVFKSRQYVHDLPTVYPPA